MFHQIKLLHLYIYFFILYKYFVVTCSYHGYCVINVKATNTFNELAFMILETTLLSSVLAVNNSTLSSNGQFQIC